MEIRLIEAVSLMNLAQTLRHKNLPIKTAFKINKLLLAIENHVNFYYEKTHELINTYGSRDENGELKFTEDRAGYLIAPENQNDCNLELQELGNLIIELPNNIKFALDELDDLTISVQDMYTFSKFIQEE